MDRVKDILNINDIHGRGITGKGTVTAILDTGIYRHPDINQQIIAFKDMVSGSRAVYDNNGHGTHIAGIISGSGKLSGGKYRGIAPGSKIVMVKVLDRLGKGNVNNVINGINWIIQNKQRFQIRILNISIGTIANSPEDEYSDLVKAVDAAWDAGLIVVVAAGNNGPNPYTVTVPGISRKVITVGASDEKSMVDRYGNKITDFSGRGPTLSCIQKPDIVAPSREIISCKVMRNYKYKHISDAYIHKSGTSMATPIVCGVIALLLENEPHLTPKDVKIRIRDSAHDLGLPKNQQGWGQINPLKLIKH